MGDIFTFLILVSAIAVFSAIKLIFEENKKRKKAKAHLKKFEEEFPSKN